MATLGSIRGAEPSTVTFEIRTVKINQNSTVMHQEILSIGDPDTSNAIAAVLNAAPASTAWGMAVREVSPITTVRVSQSSAADLNVTATQGTNPWTIAGNSTHIFPSGYLSSAVLAGNSSALSVRNVWSSTNADQPVSAAQAGTWTVTVSGYSTTVNVSSLAGAVIVRSSKADALVTAYQSSAADLNATVAPSSTNWASSAGFHFDSSGALQIAGSFSANTSTGPLTVSQLLDSSGGSITAGDSANNALRVNVVAGAAGGSTIVTVSTGSVRVHQSTYTDLNGLMRLADRDQSTQVAAILNAAPASSVWALAVREVSPIAVSTTVQVSSLAGKVLVDQNSTVWQVQVSSLAGAVIVRSSKADALVSVYQSTASELLATVTIGTNLQSTAAPSSNSSGLVVRQVIDALTTFASTSALASTTVEVASSAANIRHYVTAYSITSTNQTPAHWGFFSSNGALLWPVTLAALSSATCGANLAVAPPGYLFRTTASDALNFKTAGSTVSGVQLAVSYFRAP